MKKKLIVYFLVLVFLAISITISERYKKNQDYIKQQNIKKDIQEGIKKAAEENKKQEELKKYSNPSPNSQRSGDSNEKSQLHRVDNIYCLYKSEYLNINQFIYVDDYINKGINNFSKTPDDATIEKLYGLNHDEYMKLKEQVLKVGDIKKVVIDESSIVKSETIINFKLNIIGESQNTNIRIDVDLKDTETKIKWSI